MQIVAITDIITHFVGLLHVAPDSDRDWSHPDGAGASAKTDPGPWAHFRSGHTVSDAAGSAMAPMGIPATPESEDRLLQAWKASLHRLAPAGPPASPTHRARRASQFAGALRVFNHKLRER